MNTIGKSSIFCRAIVKVAFILVLLLMSSAEMSASKYMFYFKDSNGDFHFMAAAATYPTGVTTFDSNSCVWFCKSSRSTSASDATIGTTGKYFYAVANSKNYWIMTADGDGSQVETTTSTGNADEYSIDNNGYFREGTGKFYVYYQSSDNTWRTSKTESKYNEKRPKYLEYTGSDINSTTVNSYPEAGGYVFVKGDSKYTGESDKTTDVASRTYPAVYYLYAYPKSGYEFLGWSKTPGGTIVSTATEYKISVENTLETYYANYKALVYTVSFEKNSSTATGSMAPVTPTIGVNYTLPELGFVDDITVTFDANGGTFPAKATNKYSETQSKFKEWSGSDGNTYANKGIINKSTPDPVTLTAQWYESRPFTVPSATRGDRELRGYNNEGGTSTSLIDGVVPGEIVYPTASYTLYAIWGDPFYAKVNLSADAGASDVPTVDAEEKSSDNKNDDIVFNIEAKPAKTGNIFVGWIGDGVTFGDATSLATTAKAKSSGTAGSSNANIYNIKATYRAAYSIVINANCEISRPDERVAFLVSGPQNYEVSVPVRGTITLYDVEPGDYTITPEAAWSWNYTVSEAQTTSFDPTTKVSTNTFTVTPKGSEKKHTEKTSTTVY